MVTGIKTLGESYVRKSNGISLHDIPSSSTHKRQTQSVLFVSNTARSERPYLDPSTRYRSHNLATALAKLGYRTALASQKMIHDNPSLVDRFDLVHFHRPIIDEKSVELLMRLAVVDKIIADFDDSIFNVSRSHLTPAHRFRGVSLPEIARTTAQIAEATSLFSRFTVSTEPLKQEICELFTARQIEIIPNALPPSYIGLAYLIREQMRGKTRPYKLGYFSGTATHDADLNFIAPVIAKELRKNRRTRFLLGGAVNIPERLEQFTDQIDIFKIVPFTQLPFLMAQVDTVVAPLEWTHFTRAKSGLKFFEAAVLGCLVVATPIPDIERFNSPLLRKCADIEHWEQNLCDDYTLDDQIRYEAATTIAEETSIEPIAERWSKTFLKENLQ